MKNALKELRYYWKKYLLVGLIIILLMFMVLFLTGLVRGLGRAVSSGVESTPANYFILQEEAEGLITVSNIPKDSLNKIQSLTDTKSFGLDIQRMYLQTEESDEKTDIVYFAIDPKEDLSPDIISGDSLSKNSSEHEIVLNDDFMETVNLGDNVLDSSTGLSFKVVGFTKDKMYGHVSVGYISKDTYSKLMTDINPLYQPSTHALALTLDDKSASDLSKKLKEEIDSKSYVLLSKEDVVLKLPGYQAEQMTITMVVWVLLLIAALILAIFFYIINLQKMKEFGIMKAIGISGGELVRFIVSEVFLVAFIGTIIADILVYAMASALPNTMPFYLQNNEIALVSVSFILISLVGSLASIIRVAKLDPVQVIGGENS